MHRLLANTDSLFATHNYLLEKGLLPANKKCLKCDKAMIAERARKNSDGYRWRCPRPCFSFSFAGNESVHGLTHIGKPGLEAKVGGGYLY